MTRYTIVQNDDCCFIVRVSDGIGWIRNSPAFTQEAEADAWIVEEGRGTEYTVSRE
jgi:hypothetical protein